MLRIAWAESPGLAIQLATRFPSGKLSNDIRKLLLSFPEKAIDEPGSLEIMFESALPADVSSQLKVSSMLGLSFVPRLTSLVLAILGPRQPNRRLNLFLACVWQPPLHFAICDESIREPFS